MQSPSAGFQSNVEDRVAVRGFQQSFASPIADREAKQDQANLQSPTVPQSALAARLKDPTSPANDLKESRSGGSLAGAEPSATTDKNKVGNNAPPALTDRVGMILFCFKPNLHLGVEEHRA